MAEYRTPEIANKQPDAAPSPGPEPVPAIVAASPLISEPEPRNTLTYSPPAPADAKCYDGDASELANRGSPISVERPSKRLRRDNVFSKSLDKCEPVYSALVGREDPESVECAHDVFAAYPELRMYKPTLAEAFALDKAFTSERAHSVFSRIVYEHGQSHVKQDAYHAGGRQYFPQQLHQSLKRMGRVVQDIVTGQTIVQNCDNQIIDLKAYWAEDTNDEEPDAETARDRIFALLKEVQYVYAEGIVRVARANNYTYKPTEQEMDVARRAPRRFYADASIKKLLPSCH